MYGTGGAWAWRTPVSVVSAVGFLVALWLATYLTAARARDRAGLWAAASLFALALYFLPAVLCFHVPAVHAGFLWRRFLGWFVVPFFALWLHATLAVSATPPGRWRHALLYLSDAAAVGLSALWLLGNWTFASTSFQPLELRLPVATYALLVSSSAVANCLAFPCADRRLARALAGISGAWGLGVAVLPQRTSCSASPRPRSCCSPTARQRCSPRSCP